MELLESISKMLKIKKQMTDMKKIILLKKYHFNSFEFILIIRRIKNQFNHRIPEFQVYPWPSQ